MDGYNYNRHYYNNMMCGDGYSSYNYMYSNGGMYACGGLGRRIGTAAWVRAEATTNNGTTTGGTGSEGVAYQDQQYHHQQHEHDLNFTFNFFEQSGGGGGTGGGPGGGGQGGGTGGSTAPSENSNSSDFNFLTNLANDFAPEYYQLS
ncbi:neurogenic protein mastermind-like [Scylla paramamosain]|uniref:neurogenic protein mastermind-like n=1 Tax=Scylla paramamosain TaxID=85552 RepID=UPI0030837549